MQNWNVFEAHEAGMDECVLPKVIVFAIQNESGIDRDIGTALEQGHFEEPWPIGEKSDILNAEIQALAQSSVAANLSKHGLMSITQI